MELDLVDTDLIGALINATDAIDAKKQVALGLLSSGS
jgi:hypothetical protein